MNILIAGGSGFLGRALHTHLSSTHNIYILTRKSANAVHQIHWDGNSMGEWAQRLTEMDAVINLTGFGLEHWPWTQRQKQRFIDSRVLPGLALAEAFEKSSQCPGTFIQISGINRYGLRGNSIADESTPPAEDFLAQLTVHWEDATKTIEELGVRRIIARNSVVLARRGGLFPLMALPVRLLFGGNFGDGKQSMNWIHLKDYVHAIEFLLENDNANGAFNLISPQPTTNEEFMRAIAKTLRRPFWFHVPKWLLKMMLGEMSVMLTEGRPARPQHLLDLGYQFEYGNLDLAMKDLFSR